MRRVRACRACANEGKTRGLRPCLGRSWWRWRWPSASRRRASGARWLGPVRRWARCCWARRWRLARWRSFHGRTVADGHAWRVRRCASAWCWGSRTVLPAWHASSARACSAWKERWPARRRNRARVRMSSARITTPRQARASSWRWTRCAAPMARACRCGRSCACACTNWGRCRRAARACASPAGIARRLPPPIRARGRRMAMDRCRWRGARAWWRCRARASRSRSACAHRPMPRSMQPCPRGRIPRGARW